MKTKNFKLNHYFKLDFEVDSYPEINQSTLCKKVMIITVTQEHNMKVLLKKKPGYTICSVKF